MSLFTTRHLLLQWLRHLLRGAALLLVVGVVYLSLYAHYRASRAIEDEYLLRDFNGRVMRHIHRHVGAEGDPQEFLDGFKGTLWSMRIAGVDISDPLAAAELTATSRRVHWPMIVSILIPVGVTLLLGRVFCSWLCPAGLLLELTDKLRWLLRLAEIKPGQVKFSHRNKYVVLAAGLVIGAVVGLPIFALAYPPAVMSRAVHAWVFGTSLTGMLTILGVMVAVEVFISPRWWCRTMCPGGALYGLLGVGRVWRVKLDAARCTGCRECEPVCPMGLDPVKDSARIECDNCLACLRHCPERALFTAISVSARPRKRPRTPLAAAAAVTLLILILPADAQAHHILGLPHYSYKENYPQAPTLEYPATTGPYHVLMTSYPGKPVPGESATIAFYITRLDDGQPVEMDISVRVLQTFTFGRNREVLSARAVHPFDAMHKVNATFPADGEYIVELSLQVEGRTEVIPFLMVAGQPGATASILTAVGAGLGVFIVVVRAVKIKRDRRRVAAA